MERWFDRPQRYVAPPHAALSHDSNHLRTALDLDPTNTDAREHLARIEGAR